jgi:hypothetical protein
MNLAGPNGTTLPLNQNGSGATRFSSDYREVVWLSRRSAMEYAGFLEWLWRLGGAPCEVVDLTDLRISIRPPQPPVLAVSVAALSPDQIRGNNLWDLAEPLQMRARDRYLDLWRQLRSENAPLRVIDGEKLLSAPITFFDSLLLSYAKPNWQKVGWSSAGHWPPKWMKVSFRPAIFFWRLASTRWSKAVAWKSRANPPWKCASAR